MRMNIVRHLAVFVLAGVMIVACRPETEQDKVKKVITTIQRAAEEKEIGKVLDRLSRTYRDPQGNDYNGIKALLLFYFYRHQKVSVYIPTIEATVTDATAKALFQAVLTGGGKAESVKDLLPEALGVYNFDVDLVRESGAWKVASARWKRAGEGLPGAAQ